MKLSSRFLASSFGLFAMMCGVAGLFVQPAAGASEDAAKALSGKTIRII